MSPASRLAVCHYPQIPARRCAPTPTPNGWSPPTGCPPIWVSPGLAIVESDEDVLLYDVGHIPGAVKIDWHTDLNDPRVRDYINGEQFAELMDRKGIARDDTVVIYGDKSNWWAAYALWVFTLVRSPRCAAAQRRARPVDLTTPRHHAGCPEQNLQRLSHCAAQ